MVLDAPKLSVTEFDEWVLHPENRAHNFEYVGGEIAEVVSNSKSSKIGCALSDAGHEVEWIGDFAFDLLIDSDRFASWICRLNHFTC